MILLILAFTILVLFVGFILSLVIHAAINGNEDAFTALVVFCAIVAMFLVAWSIGYIAHYFNH
jgi:hypothetical protein